MITVRRIDMKKILSILLALALCISLFACGNNNDSKDDNKNTAEPTAIATATVQPTETPEPTATPEPKFGKENLALNKPTEVDGVEGGDEEIFGGQNAVDGDDETRWSGLGATTESERHFIKIDLGQSYKIGNVVILWESCNASFFIELLDENGERVDFVYCDAADEELLTENFFGGKLARYVVLHVSKTAFASPYEIEVYEQLKEDSGEEAAKTNIAKNGTAVADRNENELLTPDKAIDGDYTTRWAPGGQQFENDITWTLDLGEKKTINEISVYFESNQAEYSLQIAADENGPWETVYEWEDTDIAGKLTVPLEAKEARYVRYLRPAGTEGWCSFYEVEVIGK